MILYRVMCENDEGATVEQWCATRSEAKAVLAGWRERLADPDAWGVIQRCNPPPTKSGMAEWLNANVTPDARVK